MTLLKKCYDNLEEYICALLVATMVCCLSIQVIMRIITGSSFAWTEELSRYSFIWSVYVGAALAVKRNAHVRITAQFAFLSSPARLAVRGATDILWIAFNLYFASVSFDAIGEALAFPEISPTLGVVKGYVEMIIPACFILTSWRIAEQYLVHWRNGTLYDLVNYEEAA
ncbi:TRAP transporter small permease [Nitratidesulfovibrio sp. HK-II]|jgi:TRAP-type C4-dicarboxylate transport system permease small subunit|uniref:TRAP transporter small permease n=1 Tax=Nitratidesulfovibrio sp. HK-II TaxID=2009266 RepID=UPI000E2EBF49|nr:TRAP transporter small permease [Nitratidesulfovibrio sp. HK-II]GBO97576.1 TRAP-type C4-dicarboxylate transport system [Nitratidesulfovibrio sp. HK-II]